jgi:NAD-dependent SIR2 family protein deacetylase
VDDALAPAVSADAVGTAAAALDVASALLVTAGAGMGVDSGLPDFRGPEGFWGAYPAYRHLGLSFVDLASPRWFHEDPQLAWGFYGHRLELYRRTIPHEGFAVLRRWVDGMPHGGFVFTSNVDGHFQRAGFDDIVECHGSLAALQCLEECGQPLFASAGVAVDVDPLTFRARGALPCCPRCGALARPNVLMFGDAGWDPSRTTKQEARFERWLRMALTDPAALVVVECGAGTAVPTVRSLGEQIARRGARLVRINVREPEVPPGQVAIPGGARDTLHALDRARG